MGHAVKKKKIVILSSLAGLMIMYIFFYFSFFPAISAQTICFYFDPQLSQQATQEISIFVRSKQWGSLQEIVSTVKEKYEYIALIDAHVQPGRTIIVQIEAHEPTFVANDTHVICNNNMCYNAAVFTPDAYKYCPYIYLSDIHNPLQSSLCKTLPLINPSIHDQFIFEWESEHAIWLHSKENSSLSLLACAENIPTMEDIINSHKDIINSKKYSKEQNIIDVRFSNQLILY